MLNEAIDDILNEFGAGKKKGLVVLVLMKKEPGRFIQYENIEMIKPENNEALIRDLKARSGLDIQGFEPFAKFAPY